MNWTSKTLRAKFPVFFLGLLVSCLVVRILDSEAKRNDMPLIKDEIIGLTKIDKDNYREYYKAISGDAILHAKMKDASDLKQKKFLKSETGKVAIHDALERKKEASSLRYYSYSKYEKVYNYDVKRKRTPLHLGGTVFYETNQKSINLRDGQGESVRLYFENMPVFTSYDRHYDLTDEYLYFPMDEESGLYVEENANEVELVLIYSLASAKVVKHAAIAYGTGYDEEVLAGKSAKACLVIKGRIVSSIRF